ncbi:hypothetical protein KSP40_PGU005266 [Platanthera guangdongensis]|uniref:Uncharacterized protein n=1 Tax=Platanthera guangdongensis TaxID=2320717 RepID=A0ABR2LC97_9ASPA
MNAGSFGSASSVVFSRFRFRRSRNSTSLCPSPVKALSIPLSFHISSSLFGRPGGRPPPPDQRSRRKNIYTDRNVEFSVDLDDISTSAVDSIKRCFRTSEDKINRFFSAGTAAYDDLTSSFRIERGSRIVFSCRRSSLQFFANFFSGASLSFSLLCSQCGRFAAGGVLVVGP